jgi:prepilin-type N-terminal cleavage/methylation domain-containing protein
MKTPCQSARSRRAFTLLEMTIVIMILVALLGSGLFVSTKMDEWKLGRQASESLRMVYSAQRMLLADRPTLSVSAITATSDPSTGIIPYLPNQATSVPTVKSLTGTSLSILVNVSPPVVNAGSGTTYDPSGCSSDSLWDVGE